VCDEWTADIEFRDFEHARFKPKPLDDEVRSDCVPTDIGRPIVVECRLCDTAVLTRTVPLSRKATDEVVAYGPS
jgi:hypothetical protein